MKKYIIPEGLHISHIFPSFYKNKKEISFDFQFCSNCKYDNGVFIADVNKLCGVSFGLIHNKTTLWGKIFKSHANSFRIGWNCEKRNGKIQLYAYYYNKGIRTIEYITEVDPNKPYTANLYFDRTSNEVIADINGSAFNIYKKFSFDFSNSPKYGIILKPYFGGSMAAPQRMSIYLNTYFIN